jgi:eukaryotic-like serine/threonine-protein kinase
MPVDVIANKYKIVREIARSNDVVYEAIDTTMGRRLAVKELVIPPNLTGQARRERIERFNREARAAGKLSHPNIVTVYDYGEDNGRYFIAMEYLEGGTLRDTLQTRGALPLNEATEIASQVLSALAHAHSHQVVHRDVKPDNIHILPGGQVKLTDFGIARLTEEASLTGEGQVFGTPSYMSPEQIKGIFVDHRSDIFSLAIVLYEMLAGRKPFTGDSVISITYSIMENQPPPLGGVSYGVEQVILRALNKDASRRYNSADEMRRELKNADSVPSMFLSQTGMGGMGGGLAPLPGAGGAPSWGGGTYGGGLQGPGPMHGPMPTAGGLPSTVYTPPPVGAPPTQGGGPFVNWGGAGQNPAQAAPAPPAAPFPRRRDSQGLSEFSKTLLTVCMVVVVLSGAIVGFVLLFLNAYETQQQKGAAAAVGQLNDQGKKLYDAGDLQGAAEAFEKAFRAGPNTPAGETARKNLGIAWNRIGLRAFERGDWKGAETAWYKVLDLDPKNSDALYNLGKLYDRIGDKDRALQAWQKAKDSRVLGANPADPGNDTALQARLAEAQQLYDAGVEAYQKGDMETARANWQRVIEKATGNPLAEKAKNMLNTMNQSQTQNSPYLNP